MNCIGTSEEEYNTVRETKRRPSTNKFVDCGDYIKGITAKGVEYLIDKSAFENGLIVKKGKKTYHKFTVK